MSWSIDCPVIVIIFTEVYYTWYYIYGFSANTLGLPLFLTLLFHKQLERGSLVDGV